MKFQNTDNKEFYKLPEREGTDFTEKKPKTKKQKNRIKTLNCTGYLNISTENSERK